MPTINITPTHDQFHILTRNRYIDLDDEFITIRLIEHKNTLKEHLQRAVSSYISNIRSQQHYEPLWEDFDKRLEYSYIAIVNDELVGIDDRDVCMLLKYIHHTIFMVTIN